MALSNKRQPGQGQCNGPGLGKGRCCVDAGPWHGFRRFLSLHKKKKIFVNYSMFCLSGHSCLVDRWLTAYRQLHTLRYAASDVQYYMFCLGASYDLRKETKHEQMTLGI